jgi:hypothetical protein
VLTFLGVDGAEAGDVVVAVGVAVDGPELVGPVVAGPVDAALPVLV